MRRVLGALCLTTAVLAACGHEPAAGPATTTVPVTTIGPAAEPVSTTTAPGPSAVATSAVPTSTIRPNEPIDPTPAAVAAKAFVRDGEFLDSAVRLPGGDLVLAVRTGSRADLCSSALFRVAVATGGRTLIAPGRQPSVSPDGTRLAYAVRGEATDPHGGPGCVALDLAVLDLRTGATQTLPVGPGTAGAVSVDLRWSPDGTRISFLLGFDFSEIEASAVADLPAGRVTTLSVAPELAVVLAARSGARPETPWRPMPARWLADGTLAVWVTCCYGESIDRFAVPMYWRLPADGVLRSLDQAIGDDATLDLLPHTPWEARDASPTARVWRPGDPVPDVTGFLRPGEVADNGATALDGSSVLVAVRTGFDDLCSASIERIDTTTGERERFAAGAWPVRSPDTTRVVYARVTEPEPGRCAVDEVVVRSLVTGTETTVAASAGRPARVAVRPRWSFDSSWVTWSTGGFATDESVAVLYDLVRHRVQPMRVDAALAADLQRRTGAGAAPCAVEAGPWLTDFRLAVAVDCREMGVALGDVPQWFVLPRDGVVRAADEITDPVVLADLAAGGW